VATYLNIFIRHCDVIGMANLAQLVNVIAPIFTRPDGLFLQTIYHPFWLYANLSQEIALDVYVECEQHQLAPETEAAAASWWTNRVADLGPFNLLDAAATRDPARSLVTVAVVNRDRDVAHRATVQFADEMLVGLDAHEVNGAEPGARNSFEQPEAVAVQRRPLDCAGQSIDYIFPAHSLTVLRFQTASRAS
jgi:alpha-N-arabinofuranosidase